MYEFSVPLRHYLISTYRAEIFMKICFHEVAPNRRAGERWKIPNFENEDHPNVALNPIKCVYYMLKPIHHC